VDNGAEEDRERDGSTSSSTTWRTCSSMWRIPRIELNGEGEPVWLTHHLRDPQPEGERERDYQAVLDAPENVSIAAGISQIMLCLMEGFTISGLRRHLGFSYVGP